MKKTYKNFRKWLAVKKNRRHFIILILSLLLVVGVSLFAVWWQLNERSKAQLNNSILRATEDIVELEKLKTSTKQQLELKSRALRLKNAEIKQLQKKLEAKRKIPTVTNFASGVGWGNGYNGYSYGWCTFFAKQQEHWVRNGWGNANSWDEGARAAGFYVGPIPKVDSVGQSDAGWAGHVVVVTQLLPNHMIKISEMAYVGWNRVSTRIVPWSAFEYIRP